jgi:hypothetical protein
LAFFLFNLTAAFRTLCWIAFRLDQYFIDHISRDHLASAPMPIRSVSRFETPSCAIDPEVSTHQR